MEGPDKEVFFTQDHVPGKVLVIDWTDEESLGICAHYGITPRTINVGRAQENGDCESSRTSRR
ncbi:MAG: transposase InsO family protein [Akkermansiaceae bacterium]